MKAAILTNQLYSWKNHNELAIGGGERVAWRLSGLLLEMGYEVHIYQHSNVKFTKFVGGVFIHGVSVGTLALDGYISGIADYFYDKTSDFDVVILNLPDVAGGKVREDAILLTQGIMFFMKDLSELSEEDKERLYKIWSSAGMNVVVHPVIIDAVRSLGFNEIADKMICIDNCVETDVFKPQEKKPIVLFPGRAEEAKGAKFIPEILESLADTGWKVVWAGDGSWFRKIKALEMEYPSFSAISAPLDSVQNIFAKSAICVVFNLASKGNSLTMMEGMASECACIGIDGGTTLIEHGVNGILCQPNVKDISDAIKALIKDEELRNRLGVAARESAIANHSVSLWKEKWADIINGDV